MNKENKNINLALRICLIVTWIMSNISLFVLFSGLANIETEGLDKDNIGERLLKVISDFSSKTTLYYVTMAMLVVCLVLAVISRYKTTIVSYIFKLLSLLLSLVMMIGGVTYVGALRECSGLSGLVVNGTSKEAVEAALSSANFSGDASKIAETLTNKDEAAAAFAGYLFPIFILFVLMITSIHCLVKKSDPNNKGSIEKQ